MRVKEGGRQAGFDAGLCGATRGYERPLEIRVGCRHACRPHIARLREKVGHDLLLLPTVAVLPIDEQGQVLLIRQMDFGTFGTIAGGIDEDESPRTRVGEKLARRPASMSSSPVSSEQSAAHSSGLPTPTATRSPASASSLPLALFATCRSLRTATRSNSAHWFALDELQAPAVGSSHSTRSIQSAGSLLRRRLEPVRRSVTLRAATVRKARCEGVPRRRDPAPGPRTRSGSHAGRTQCGSGTGA